MTVAPERLRGLRGVAEVTFVGKRGPLAVVDTTLSGEPPLINAAAHGAMVMTPRADRKPAALGPDEVGIDNFQFAPTPIVIKAGHSVTWINRDDVPHVIVNVERKFRESPVLDTGRRYVHRFAERGTYNYFCSIHPTMTGTIVVT